MARSRRKTPCTAWTSAVSEKWEKTVAHRKVRHRVRLKMHGDAEVLPTTRELSDPWRWGKDGRMWFGGKPSEWINARKLMRK